MQFFGNVPLEVTEDFFEVVRKRRAIRKFREHNIPPEDLEKILEAARLAPSANNSQPWSFIVVKDQDKKRLLAKPSPQTFIANANTIVVVLGDSTVSCCPRATWTTRDPMIVTEHLVLAATALGYGTCWIANYESRPDEWVNEVKRSLKIPDHQQILVLVALGVLDESPAPRPRESLEEKCFEGVYGNLVRFH